MKGEKRRETRSKEGLSRQWRGEQVRGLMEREGYREESCSSIGTGETLSNLYSSINIAIKHFALHLMQPSK